MIQDEMVRVTNQTEYIYISIILKYQFQRSSRVIFLQITSHIYFKLTHCTPISSVQTTSRSQTTPPHIDG
jgi:hypothetical protein